MLVNLMDTLMYIKFTGFNCRKFAVFKGLFFLQVLIADLNVYKISRFLVTVFTEFTIYN